jgi:hypothetical protein
MAVYQIKKLETKIGRLMKNYESRVRGGEPLPESWEEVV